MTALLGMAWRVAGGGLTRRVAIGVAVALSAFALLPYSLERMGMDVRLLLLANLLALGVGWAIGRYAPLGTARWATVAAVGVFVLILLLLRGVPGIPGLQPVSSLYWGGLMLNLLLAVAGITLSLPIGIALALGRRSRLPVIRVLCVVFIEVFRGVPPHSAVVHVPSARASSLAGGLLPELAVSRCRGDYLVQLGVHG